MLRLSLKTAITKTGRKKHTAQQINIKQLRMYIKMIVMLGIASVS
jgi:hypothetical protein